MAICAGCGCEFDPSDVRDSIDRWYGEGSYDYSYPDGDACEDCAMDAIGAAKATGEEIRELMGPVWDWDDE